jgi:hypothetical protein
MGGFRCEPKYNFTTDQPGCDLGCFVFVFIILILIITLLVGR